MRIAIDARALIEQRTGLGRYLLNLVRRFGDIAPDNTYTLYCRPDVASLEFADQSCYELRVLESSWMPNKGTLWEQVLLPSALRRDKPDVLFSPNYTAPLLPYSKMVVTVHDMIKTSVRGEFSRLQSFSRSLFSGQAVRAASKIITDSLATKSALEMRYRAVAEKLVVIPAACEPIFRVIEDEKRLKDTTSKYGLDRRFIFYLGTIFRRRHVPVLLRAFRSLLENDRSLQLLIVGKNRMYPEYDLRGLIEQLKLGDHVRWEEYVPEEDLVALYNAAELFVYVSSHEGFGLPVLEAMACGCPVITSNVSSLPEVAGEAAVLVTPGDADELLSAMREVLGSERLKTSLREKGLQREKTFSWERAAEETLRVLEAVAS